VTPSAVSHQIKLLEEQFGVRLFHRAHRAVVLTDAGRVYAEEVSAAFAKIEMATRELGRTAKSDILTVHSTPSFATQWLMPRLARFSALEARHRCAPQRVVSSAPRLTDAGGGHRHPLWNEAPATGRNHGASLSAGDHRPTVHACAHSGRASDPFAGTTSATTL